MSYIKQLASLAAGIGLSALITGCTSISNPYSQKTSNKSEEEYLNPHGRTSINANAKHLSFKLESDYFTRAGERYFIERDFVGISDSGFLLRPAESSETSIVLDRTDKTVHFNAPIYYALPATNHDGKTVIGVNLMSSGPNNITAGIKFIDDGQKGNTNYNHGKICLIELSRPLNTYTIDPDGKGPSPATSYFSPSRKGGDLDFCFIPNSEQTKFEVKANGQLTIYSPVIYQWHRATQKQAEAILKEKQKREREKQMPLNTPIVGDITSDVIKP